MPLHLALYAMGTRFELVLDNEHGMRAAGEDALAAVAEAEARLSAFRRDSLVARLNSQAGGPPLRVDDEFLDLLELCREVHEQSAGAFDPTVAPLMESWGFRGPRVGAACGPARIGLPLLKVDRGARSAQLPGGVKLDLGAVGKGWALDRAAECLRAAGVRRALMHGGTSTVIALGSPPGMPAWKVAVRHPRRPDVVLATVELCDAALSVSATLGQSVRRNGRQVGHVLDPRRRSPVAERELAAVTAASAACADAWSTALLVLGERPRDAPLLWTLIHASETSATQTPHASPA